MAGMKRIFQTKLTDVASSDLEGVGTHRIEGDNEYVWCKGVASTAQYDAVTIESDYTTVRLTKAQADKLRRIGVAQAAIVANKYGWYQIRGTGKVKVLASCGKDSQLYTCATAGSLDDAGTSQTAVRGIVLSASCGSSAAATSAVMHYPNTFA